MISEMSAKHVELLKEIYQPLSDLAILWNSNNASHPSAIMSAQVSAQSLSAQTRPMEVRHVRDLDAIFASIVKQRANGVLFLAYPIFFIQLKRMAEFTTSSRLPAITNFVEFPKFGD